MTSGIGYALGATVCFGLGDLVYKRGAAAGAPPHQFLMVQSWFFMPCVLAFSLLTGALRFSTGLLWGALAGLLVLIGFYNFAHSLRSGAVSVNAPVFRLSFTITTALAVLLLHEPLGMHKLAGIALALLAVWLLLAAPMPGDAPGRRASRASLARVLVATAAVGVANFVYVLGLRAGSTPAALIVAQASVVVPFATAFAGVVDHGIRPSRAALAYAPIAAVLLAFAFSFLVEGLAHGEASIVVPIGQMGFVVTALAGFVLLREPFTWRKGAGLAAALAALAVLAYG
jgi:drug/metabolite transporter (DMT)-like permease